MTRLAFARLAVYIAMPAFSIAVYAAIGLAIASLAGCASPSLQVTTEAVAPPRAAVYWAVGLDLPATAKDCNRYAREAFARLTAQGLHPRYVAAITETGEGHMFVEAEGWAYDNLRSRPVPLTWLTYRMVEASDNGVRWFRIGGVS